MKIILTIFFNDNIIVGNTREVNMKNKGGDKNICVLTTESQRLLKVGVN